MPNLCQCLTPSDCSDSQSDNCKNARKAILGALRNHLPLRNMEEGEAVQFWRDWLADTARFSIAEMRQVCDRVRREPGRKWFPTVGEFMEHAKCIDRGPSRAALIQEQQKLLVQQDTGWTPEKIAEARATIKPGSPSGLVLSKLLDAVEKTMEEE